MPQPVALQPRAGQGELGAGVGAHGDRHRLAVDLGDGGPGAVDDLAPSAVLVEGHHRSPTPNCWPAITTHLAHLAVLDPHGVGGGVQGGHVGALVGEHDRLVAGPVRARPPAGQHRGLGLLAGVHDRDPPVGPPDGHRLGGLAGALEGERVAVELMPLAEVLPQVDGTDPGHHTAQVPAGLDRGQLPVVADQDHLGTGGGGVGEQAVVVAGADHAGLVDDQHRVGPEPAVARVVQLPQQPGDVDAVADAGARGELLDGLVGEGGTDHPVPGGGEGVVDHGQRASCRSRRPR